MGCWEEICLKILFWLFLILSEYVENCLNLCPSSARREAVFGRLRAAAYDHLRLAGNRLYRYHFDGIIQFFHMNSWVLRIIYFFELNGCRNNIIIILRYVDGGIPLRHPSCFFVISFRFSERRFFISMYTTESSFAVLSNGVYHSSFVFFAEKGVKLEYPAPLMGNKKWLIDDKRSVKCLCVCVACCDRSLLVFAGSPPLSLEPPRLNATVVQSSSFNQFNC